jgi:hypothetical protein
MRQRNRAAQLCPTCGHRRSHHRPRDGHECPVPKEVIERLRAFRAEHGKNWKASLLKLWTSGRDDGQLRQARNMIGPTALYKLKT